MPFAGLHNMTEDLAHDMLLILRQRIMKCIDLSRNDVLHRWHQLQVSNFKSFRLFGSSFRTETINDSGQIQLQRIKIAQILTECHPDLVHRIGSGLNMGVRQSTGNDRIQIILSEQRKRI